MTRSGHWAWNLLFFGYLFYIVNGHGVIYFSGTYVIYFLLILICNCLPSIRSRLPMAMLCTRLIRGHCYGYRYFCPWLHCLFFPMLRSLLVKSAARYPEHRQIFCSFHAIISFYTREKIYITSFYLFSMYQKTVNFEINRNKCDCIFRKKVLIQLSIAILYFFIFHVFAVRNSLWLNFKRWIFLQTRHPIYCPE